MKTRHPEKALAIITDAMQAFLNEPGIGDDPDLIVSAFRRIADHLESTTDDDGTLTQLFEDVATRIELAGPQVHRHGHRGRKPVMSITGEAVMTNGAIPVYTAHFTPEAWQNDQAIEVDPGGPQTWDCTAYASQHMAYLARLAAEHGAPDGLLDNDDVFKDDPAAPQWIRDWRGPFTIRITEGPSLSRTNLARLSEAIGGVLGTDPETARWHAAQVMGAQEAMRRESGETGDNTGGYPPEYGPWSVEPTALAAWVTYRELKGE